MKKLLAVALFVFAAVLNSFPASTNQPPTSAEQLRSEFEAALKTSDTNVIKSLLYDWQKNGTNSVEFEDIPQSFFGTNLEGKIESVKLKSLEYVKGYSSKEEKSEMGDKILIFTPNLTAIGAIEVKVQPDDTNYTPWAEEFIYGSTNNIFYLRDTVKREVSKPTTQN